MRKRIIHFFQDPFYYKPTDEDVNLITGIVDQLKAISGNFSSMQQKFVDSLIECLRNAYDQYRHEHSSVMYRLYREGRSVDSLENGPKLAEERRWLLYWRKSSSQEVKNLLQQEMESQLLAPLQKALREGTAINKNSRADFLLRFLKKDIQDGHAYSCVAAVSAAAHEQLMLIRIG